MTMRLLTAFIGTFVLLTSFSADATEELLCVGNVAYNGTRVDGTTSLMVTIDKSEETLKVVWGETEFDYPYREEPNRYFYYFLRPESSKLDTFFEIDRSSLNFRYIRLLKSNTGEEFVFETEGTCSTYKPKI